MTLQIATSLLYLPHDRLTFPGPQDVSPLDKMHQNPPSKRPDVRDRYIRLQKRMWECFLSHLHQSYSASSNMGAGPDDSIYKGTQKMRLYSRQTWGEIS